MPTITIPGNAIPWSPSDSFSPFVASNYVSPVSFPCLPGDILSFTYVSGLVIQAPGAPHGTPGSYDPAGVGPGTGGGIFRRPSDSIPGEFVSGSDCEFCGAFADALGAVVGSPVTLKTLASGPITLSPAPAGTAQFLMGVNRYEDWSFLSGGWTISYGGASSSPGRSDFGGSFDEIQLPANYSWGAKVGHAFSTDLLVLENSFDDRHPNWLQEIGVYDISHTVRTRTQAQELLNFFYCRYGRAFGFRFKDWNDFQATMEPMGGGPDFAGATGFACNTTISSAWKFRNVAQVTTAAAHHLSVGQKFTITASTPDFNGTWKVLTVQSATVITFKCAGANIAAPGVSSGLIHGNPYQLGKSYLDILTPYFRKIPKPCSGLVADATGHTPPIPIIYANGTPQATPADYALDTTTGLVTFTAGSGTGPANGTLLQWTGDFDVPVRFETDLALLSMKSENEASWDNLQLIGLTIL